MHCKYKNKIGTKHNIQKQLETIKPININKNEHLKMTAETCSEMFEKEYG